MYQVNLEQNNKEGEEWEESVEETRLTEVGNCWNWVLGTWKVFIVFYFCMFFFFFYKNSLREAKNNCYFKEMKQL